jgi:hypothetical protein
LWNAHFDANEAGGMYCFLQTFAQAAVGFPAYFGTTPGFEISSSKLFVIRYAALAPAPHRQKSCTD